jgi:hypothetical protein
MSRETTEKRFPKYDKHGKVRPFQDRPFVDELSEKDHQDEVLLALWRMENEQLNNNKKTNEINIILKVILVFAIISIIYQNISVFISSWN